MVCVLKDGDSCRHHPLRPIPTHHISLILPTDGTHTDFLDICLLTPQHIPGSPSSKRENVNHLIPKHQCLWRHSHHDKAYKGEIASPDPVSKETSAQVKSFRPYRQWQQSKEVLFKQVYYYNLHIYIITNNDSYNYSITSMYKRIISGLGKDVHTN